MIATEKLRPRLSRNIEKILFAAGLAYPLPPDIVGTTYSILTEM